MYSLVLIFFDAFFTGLVFFSLFFWVFTFLKIELILASLPGIFFFILSLIRKLSINKILKIEKEYPELKEKLRTSRDYRDSQFPVVMALHTEVMNLINKVDINALLNNRKLFLKISGILVLLFSTLIISSANFNIYSITSALSINSEKIEGIREKADKLISTEVNFRMAQDFLENGSKAELGKDEINLTLDIHNTDIDVSKIDNPDENDFGEIYPENVEGSGQESYEENLEDEHKEVIKNYFKKLGEG